MATPTSLHFLCGKIGSGKSTLAERLARQYRAVLLTEDAWLSTLFGDVMSTPADYARCAAKLRTIMGPHVTHLLQAGVPVVLDFPANTKEVRRWMHDILRTSQVEHVLHVLDVPDAVCLARLQVRNAEGVHPFKVTEAQFHHVSRYFEPPSPDEGFNIEVHHVSS